MTKQANEELREQVAEIFGLETSPDGEPYQLLEYNDKNEVIAGTDFSEEVGWLMQLIESAKKELILTVAAERAKVSQLQTLLAQERRLKREAVLEARLDELQKLPYYGDPYGTDVFGYEQLFKDNRIAEIKRQALKDTQGEKE